MYLVLLGNISFILLALIGFVLLNYTIFIKASFAFLSALLLQDSLYCYSSLQRTFFALP